MLWVQVWATVQQVRFRDLLVTIDAEPDGLRAHALMQGLIIDLSVEADLGLGARTGPGAPATVEIDPVEVAGTLQLGARPDGTVAVSIRNPQAALHAFHLQSSSPVVQAVATLVEGAVRAAVTDEIMRLLRDEAQPGLERALAKWLQPPAGVQILGRTYDYDLRLQAATYDTGGASWHLAFDALAPNPTARALAAPGSFVTAGTAPGVQTGRGGRLVVDDDALNRALYGLWAAGVLDLTIDQQFLASAGVQAPSLLLDGAALRRLLPELGAVLAGPEPARIVCEPLLPPVVELTGTPNLVTVRAAEVHLAIEVDRGSGWEPVLRAAAHIEIGASLGLSQRGLSVLAATHPRLDFDILEEPLVELDDRKIRVMLEMAITPAIPRLLNGIDVIPIPHVDQLSVFNVNTGIGGPQNDHLVVDADLQR
ncbi:MAG: hypothetical protein KatS3mg102_2447 [Planctomycetota bacterium]|nr:MAG: hypothetical protein KatS3mg102_2447 [Planctomycetota bacterium]